MSDAYHHVSASEPGAENPAGLDLPALGWVATPPAPTYLPAAGPEQDLSGNPAAGPGYSATPPAGAASPWADPAFDRGYIPRPAEPDFTPGPGSYPPAPQPYVPTPAEPATQSSLYPPMAYPSSPAVGYAVYDPASQAGSVQPYAGSYQTALVPAVMVPGQVVQTPYGAFVVSTKSKLAAGLLGIFLGGLGVGQFYRGNVGLGITQLVVSLVTCGVGWIWGFIEGIVVLACKPGTGCSLDSNRQLMV